MWIWPCGADVTARDLIDLEIATLAARQHGRVARRQLEDRGIGRGPIARRLKQRRLHPVLPGVYAVGSRHGGTSEVLMAAWLYGGPDSVLSHRGAARFWEIGTFGSVDLTSPRNRRGTANLVFHRAALPDADWIHRDALRVTTPARTLLDLAAIVPEGRLQACLTEAEVLGHLDQASIRSILDRHPSRAGAPLLRRLAGIEAGLDRRGRIRSPLEERFRAFAEAQPDWPRVIYNARLQLGGRTLEVDVLIPSARVAIELDGRSTHDVAERFHGDRERDRVLLAHGYRPVRVTSEHLDRPGPLAADFAAILALVPLARLSHA